MDTELITPLLAGFARHALTTVGGYLVASGVLSSGQVESFAGAGLVVLGVGWSWWQKVGQAKVSALLKKLTAKPTVQAATVAAEKAPEGAAVATTSKFANSGGAPAAVFIGLCLLLGAISPALAQSQTLRRPLPLTGDIKSDFNNAVSNHVTSAATGAASNAASILAKPFQDLADFLSSDADAAVSLATQIPDLKDGHGQQCWLAMSKAGEVFKAHPIPLTLKAMTDLEALRLLAISANNLCSNVHCTQVFADTTTMAQAASPVPLIIPSLHDLCSKIPQIAVVPPVDAPTPAATAPVAPKP